VQNTVKNKGLVMDQTTRSQTVNFLGFLRGQLSGLQGIPTLCYELIQNADDVKDNQGNPGASKIIFDVCDDALYVENDGVFREIDFERMQKVSWGDKREEAGTTGAFGIGFISVYQVTDSPEIFSSGQHWKFHPEAPENERIVEEHVETQHTLFRLPWAFEISQVRKELGISQVERSQLDEFAKEMSEVIQTAALFLKQVKLLEVKRSGKSVRRIQTERENDILLVADGTEVIRWQILEGDFSAQAKEMRKKHGSMIEEKRKSLITIAVPETINDKGLLYAFLPSETRTGLPFHINADFYPSSDRKRILFDVGYKSEWNNVAIQCAAETFAKQIDQVLKIFPSDKFWAAAEIIKRVSESDAVSYAFSCFWNDLKPQIRAKDTVLTIGQKSLPPTRTYYPKEQGDASEIFEELGLPIVHPSLYRHQNILTDSEIGVQILKYTTVARALNASELTKRTELDDFPLPSLRTKDGWTVFSTAINNLRERSSLYERNEGDNVLRSCAIAFGEDNALWPPMALFRADQNTRETFSCFSEVTWFFENNSDAYLPTSLVPHFGLLDGIKHLEQNQTILPELWKNGKFIPQKIYGWLEGYQTEIKTKPNLRENVRGLRIWPSAKGALRPIEELYLAGDFEDPLHLAQIVDINALGNRSEFLENVLLVEKLDFVTYIRDWIPSALNSNQLTTANRLGLIVVMAEYLGKLQGRTDLQKVLSELPLVWCGAESLFPAKEVYFDSSDVKDVLGSQVYIASLLPEHAEATQALYEWLGVVHMPHPADIIERIEDLTSCAPQTTNLDAIQKIFSYLATHWSHWDDGIRQRFSPLKKEKWLPGTKKPDLWFDAPSVFSVFSNHLFESQGNFLKVDRLIQQRGSEFVKFLNIESEPTTEQVVKHLLFMSERGKEITQEIYVFLNRFSKDAAIHLLRNTACLYLRTEKGYEYFRPDQVFWEEHPFGYCRFRLGPEFGRFKALFDALGVKSKPDADDAIKVLLELADEFGKSNLPLDDRKDVEEIIVMCWRLLSSSIDEGKITPTIIRKELGHKKTILDSRRILEPPATLFFEDRPGWGSKFELVKNNLIPRIEKAWPAMEAAGVQRISEAVATELHQCENSRENTEFENLLSDRRTLIQRVIESYRAKGVVDFEVKKLDTVSFLQADKIAILRTFRGFNRVESAHLEEVDAIFINESLYFSTEKNLYPWISIARELAYVLHPSGELSSLGIELKEILSQAFETASSMLDQYGYPRIEFFDASEKKNQEVIGIGGEGKPSESIIPTEMQTGNEDVPQEKPESDVLPSSNDGLNPDKRVSPKNEKRKTSRLISYVIPNGKTSKHNEQTDTGIRRNEIGQKGVDRVMEYEISQGRDPTDMEKIVVHHPGYDITSTDTSGTTRFIEVKSLTGIWDSQSPAQMTSNEFRTAREKSDSYWLYIVEKVETDEFRIYCICNPANQVDAYLFDHGWIHLASQNDGQ
jgi:hypothetical protein